VIYYSSTSSLAKADAQRVAAQVGSAFHGSELDAQTGVPTTGVVRFSDSRDHAFALRVGESLAGLGYSWKIDKASNLASSQLGMVEVWIPTK
jgi:hypothetical protein